MELIPAPAFDHRREGAGGSQPAADTAPRFLEFSDELANRAARLKLARVTSTCREIFDLVGITDRFVFFEDVPHAVRSFL